MKDCFIRNSFIEEIEITVYKFRKCTLKAVADKYYYASPSLVIKRREIVRFVREDLKTLEGRERGCHLDQEKQGSSQINSQNMRKVKTC